MAKTAILTKDGLVRYDENIKDYIDTGLENKVSKIDIIDNLVSTNTDAPLSANQGKVLKELIDNIEPGGGGEIPTDVQEQIDGKVSKSGDTMTGTLNIESPNFPALELTRTGTTTDYTAIQFNNDNGMLGGLAMNTVSGDMNVVNANGVGFPMLDSRNYSNYAVPKTGGTFTGDVTFDGAIIGKSEYNVLRQDYYVFHTQDGAGKAGYWKLCSITITGEYAGAPIIFHMTSRHGNGTLGVNFSGSTDISAYSVGSIKLTDNVNNCYIGKISGTSSGSVFDIYVQKEEAYGNLTVTRIDFPKYMRDLVTLTWSGAYVASMPAGITWTSSAQCIPLYENTYSSIPAATQSRVGLMSAADKTKLDYLKITSSTDVGVDDYSANAIGYAKASLFNQNDGALYKQVYSDKWVHEIFGDYRTGQLAVRGKNNGTWQSWRTVLDSGNYSSYALPKAGGTMTGDIIFNNDKGIKAANGSHILTVSSATVTPTSVMASKKPIYIGFADTSYVTYLRGTFIYLDCLYSPVTSKAWAIGSDERIKMNSELLDDEDKYITFFDNLKPRNYNYVRDEEGANKTIGFYAQEVEEALLAAGLSNEDFAGLNIIEDYEEGLGLGKDEAVYYKQFYTLSYEQFIPIIVNKIQNMEKVFNDRIAVLEKKIEELTGGTK